MINKLLNSSMQRPTPARPTRILSILLMLTIALAAGCDSTTNQAIKDCDNGAEDACKQIATTDWAKAKVVTPNGHRTLAKILNKIKYEQDIKWSEKCLSGLNAWCTNVNLANLRIVDQDSANKVESKIVQIKVAKAQAARIAEEKASYGSWQYSTDEDMASGKTSSFAGLKSENTLDLGFPYQGPQFAQLTLRRHPRYGFDAFISIDKGQILCNEYTNPHILVRFDKSDVQQFECAEPSDNSSTHAFIRNADEFERGLKGASTAYITLTLYQEGSQSLKFKVKGYDSSRY